MDELFRGPLAALVGEEEPAHVHGGVHEIHEGVKVAESPPFAEPVARPFRRTECVPGERPHLIEAVPHLDGCQRYARSHDALGMPLPCTVVADVELCAGNAARQLRLHRAQHGLSTLVDNTASEDQDAHS